MKEMIYLSTRVNIGGVEFKNPIIAASGTFGFGREYGEYFDLSKLGGICTTGITINPKDGNSGIRVYETPAGMMNSIGLENEGVESFIENELPDMKKLGTVVIANLGGNTIEEYLEGVKLLNNSDVDMLELNISCPNVKEGGMAFGIKSEVAYEVVSEVKKIIEKP